MQFLTARHFMLFAIVFVGACNDDSKIENSTHEQADSEKEFDEDSELETGSLLALKSIGNSKSPVAELLYINANPKGESRPRVSEIILRKSKNIEYTGYELGDALKTAKKSLHIQETAQEYLRLVILASDNINPIDTGILATLTFEKSGTEKATISISTESPIFAPEEANIGLKVSDPIHF